MVGNPHHSDPITVTPSALLGDGVFAHLPLLGKLGLLPTPCLPDAPGHMVCGGAPSLALQRRLIGILADAWTVEWVKAVLDLNWPDLYGSLAWEGSWLRLPDRGKPSILLASL